MTSITIVLERLLHIIIIIITDLSRLRVIAMGFIELSPALTLCVPAEHKLLEAYIFF